MNRTESLAERFELARESPWKVRNEVFRWLLIPIVRLLFLVKGIRWGEGWRIHGVPIVMRNTHGRISFGARLVLRSARWSNPLSPDHPVVICAWSKGSELVVGDDFAMTGGTICAFRSVRIGDRVTVGANVTIADTDFHDLDPVGRRNGDRNISTAPVVIESDVFIGMGSIVLKGVRIGERSVVGAGSVVTKDVPPGIVVAGNPAKRVGEVPDGGNPGEVERT